MEQRRNWRKFRELAGHLPAKKPGMAIVCTEKKVLCGALSGVGNPVLPHFRDEGVPIEHVENTAEQLSHKYASGCVSFINRDELLQLLGQISSPGGSISKLPESYYTQLERIREALKISKGEKSKLAVHLGDRPVEQFWPQEVFLFSLFDTMFSELLPERKILLLGVQKAGNELDAVALEFSGTELKNFSVPDWSGLDRQGAPADFFHRPTVERMVLWCENHFMLPTYAIFVQERVWEECRDLQRKQGNKAAWKHFMKAKSQRDADTTVLMEPEPWPIKAALHWQSLA